MRLLPLLSAGVGACWLLAACAGQESTASAREAIIGGEPSSSVEDSVVAILNNRTASSATGVVVAPTLVLTARHVVVDPIAASDKRALGCPARSRRGAPVDQATSAQDFTVLLGNRFPIEHRVGVKRFFTGASLDLCADDIVVLQLESAVNVTPLRLRLAGSIEKDIVGSLVGWGRTDQALENPAIAPPLHGKRQRKELTVVQVGPGPLSFEGGRTFSVPSNMFATGPGACLGDSGAPFIVGKDEVVGVLSTIEPRVLDLSRDQDARDCVDAFSVFRALPAANYDWLDAAFVQAGETPWYGVVPADVGAPCEDDRGCKSRRCLHAGATGFCSRLCDSGECPDGTICVDVAGEGRAGELAAYCLPLQVPQDGADADGCSVHGLGTTPAGATLMLSVLALFSIRRRGLLDRKLRRKQ